MLSKAVSCGQVFALCQYETLQTCVQYIKNPIFSPKIVGIGKAEEGEGSKKPHSAGAEQ